MAKKTKETRGTPGETSLQNANVNKKWFNDRLGDIGKTKFQLSLEFDPGSKNWLKKIMDGERRCQLWEVEWLAKRFSVTAGDLVRALGYSLPGLDVAVVGFVGADSRIRFKTSGEKLIVPGPPGSSVDTIALECRFGAKSFAFLAGQYLYYSPEWPARIRGDVMGKLCVFQPENPSESPFVGVQQPGPLNLYKILLLDGVTVVETKLAWSSPIEWTRTY